MKTLSYRYFLRRARGEYAPDNTVYRQYRGNRGGHTARLTRDRFVPEPGAATLSIRRFPCRTACRNAAAAAPSCGAAAVEVPNSSTVLLVVGGEHSCGRVLNRMPERTKKKQNYRRNKKQMKRENKNKKTPKCSGTKCNKCFQFSNTFLVTKCLVAAHQQSITIYSFLFDFFFVFWLQQVVEK